ncbi:MAG: rhomboid family intramembrane serine protease [Phycisphaeraceae bacterium]
MRGSEHDPDPDPDADGAPIRSAGAYGDGVGQGNSDGVGIPLGAYREDEPPRPAEPDRQPGPGRITVVNAILVVNIAVFFLWQWESIPLQVMADNFLVSWPLLAEGRIWVLLTSVFSHNMLLHLMINMVVLLSFGKPLEMLMGSRRFLLFYHVAGLGGSAAHVAASSLLLGSPQLPALGASGAIAGLLMLFSFSFPKARVLLFFFIPVPAIMAALAFIALDVWGLVAQTQGGGLPIGHGAHLGGAFIGILYFLVRRNEMRTRRNRLGFVFGEARPRG